VNGTPYTTVEVAVAPPLSVRETVESRDFES